MVREEGAVETGLCDHGESKIRRASCGRVSRNLEQGLMLQPTGGRSFFFLRKTLTLFFGPFNCCEPAPPGYPGQSPLHGVN